MKENISFLVELILKSGFFRIAGELENSLFVRLALLPLWENTVQGHETIYPGTVRAGTWTHVVKILVKYTSWEHTFLIRVLSLEVRHCPAVRTRLPCHMLLSSCSARINPLRSSRVIWNVVGFHSVTPPLYIIIIKEGSWEFLKPVNHFHPIH